MQVKKIMTEPDLIEWLNLKNKRQVRSLREKGLPHMKLNGHEIRYDPDLVEEWMRDNAKR
jgi:hypothetical protein